MGCLVWVSRREGKAARLPQPQPPAAQGQLQMSPVALAPRLERACPSPLPSGGSGCPTTAAAARSPLPPWGAPPAPAGMPPRSAVA